ncbi:MAG: DUF1906 domain-containing protein [Actinomycetota bacterium]|nr:DUF1906 domain-containing protein [Actinomycetota bacterium]
MEVVSVGGEPRQARAARGLRLACSVALLALATVWAPAATAAATSPSRHLQYHGYRIAVPAGWPVYDLGSDPTVCVRFNRHAVYLGRPSSAQRCPAHAVGRTEAILVEPLIARAAATAPSANPVPALTGGSAARLALPARGVIVTATWARHPQTVERALGRHSLPTSPASTAPAARSAVESRAPRRGAASAAVVFTGLGFDVCSAPSPSTMRAWRASPYHAVGIYLGGIDSACAQPNLTAAWVSQETAAGWHLIPTYVGLQAPTNSCGCKGIVPGKASAEGTVAAQDAIVRAQGLGIGSRNPIYYDMEAFPLSASNNAAVLAFLAAWTSELHAGGYLSGVYSSSNSGISLLAAHTGTSFVEPDDIWVANWNGRQSTSDPNLPSADWAAHQRLHQYLGGHNATYGGATLDIDSDYLDGATAGAALTPTLTPTGTVSPMADGSVQIRASWIGQSAIAAWQLYAADTPAGLTALGPPIKGGASTLITVHSQLSYFVAQALDSTGQPLGNSPLLATPAHLSVYGRSVFVPAHGRAGLPVGCFTSGPCRVTTTISVGSSVLASTGSEPVPADSGGVVYFKLTPAGRARLVAAGHHRLLVRVTEHDLSGAHTTTTLNLVTFVTHGRAPRRSLSNSPSLGLVGATDFVSRHSVGGILAGCFAAAPCHVSTRLTAGATTIASTNPEYLGAHELGYLIFKLTGPGRTLLAQARGNQVAATVTISDVGSGTQASGHVVLVSYP